MTNPTEGLEDPIPPPLGLEERIDKKLTEFSETLTEIKGYIEVNDKRSQTAPAAETKTVTEEIPVALPIPPVEPVSDKSALGQLLEDKAPENAPQEPAAPVVDPLPVQVVKKVTRTTTPVGIEREVFGQWSVLLRNAGGIAAVITACIIALVNAYTTFKSVTSGNGWPSETTMFIANIGPIIVGWTFMNASKTISTIMQVRGVGDKLRNTLAGALATNDNVNLRRRASDRDDERNPLPENTPLPPDAPIRP